MQLIIANYTVSLANRDVAPTTGTPGWATSGNPATGVPFTQFPAWHYNMVTAEIAYCVTASGLALASGDWTQLWQAINVPVAAEEARAKTAEGVIYQTVLSETQRAEGVEATLATRAMLQSMQILLQSTSLQIPSWATRVELRVIGGGGGGSTSSATDTSGSFAGSGGGAGGDAYGVYGVTPGGVLNVTVGAGGAQQSSGGSSSVSYSGQQLISAQGGSGGTFYATQGSSGAQGGAATGGTVWNQSGGYGGDGQSGTATFSGYGANGPFGGSGRAGSQGGLSGTHFGAGGGGAYGAKSSGATSPGGTGYQGCVLYRFLP